MTVFKRHLMRRYNVATPNFEGQFMDDFTSEDCIIRNSYGGPDTLDISRYINPNAKFSIRLRKTGYFPLFANNSAIRRIEKLPQTSDLGGMFTNCSNLEYCDLSNVEFIARNSFYRVFMNCTNLKEIVFCTPLKNEFYSLGAAFSNCTSLDHLDLSMFHKLSDITSFSGCAALKSIIFSEDLEISPNQSSIGSAFLSTPVLDKIDLGNTDFSRITGWYRTFFNCGARFIRFKGLGGAESLTAMGETFRTPNWGDGSEENRQSLVYTLLTHSCDRRLRGWADMRVSIPAAVQARLTDAEKSAIAEKGIILI